MVVYTGVSKNGGGGSALSCPIHPENESSPVQNGGLNIS